MRRALALAFLICSSALAANNAVVVRVSAVPEEGTNSVSARVENHGDQPITFCVDYGQRSVNGNIVEHTPIPFTIQAQSREQDWKPVNLNWNMGEGRRPVVLEAAKSSDFPFHLKLNGQFRLLLRYWNGSLPDMDCEKPAAGWREVKSQPARAELRYTLY